MEDDKIDLHWPKFALQLGASGVALLCSVIATTKVLGGAAFGSPMITVLLAGALIFIPFYIAARLMRVPYRTDEFERRLRNWSMTQSAVIVLVAAVSANLTGEIYHQGEILISPYIMPALFLICHAVYAQYLRHRIAHNRPNVFTDGSR